MTGVVEGEATFLEQLQAFEGRQVGPTSRAPEPVNTAMIRHWVEAVGDENPVYLDPDAAKTSVHGEIIAPPVMLQAWTMQGLKRKRTAGSAQDELMELLDSAGFTSVVATNCEQEYFRDLHPGDHLSVTSTIESVSPEKQTALGTGHFVTTRQTFTDDAGEMVATMLFRILKYSPAKSGQEATKKPSRPRPGITRDNAFWWEGVQAGKLLIQRCGGCGTLRHPPRPMCPRCQSLGWDTVESSGRGVVYSFVVSHYPQVPAFDYPLAIGLIELEEGTRLVSNVVDVDPADVHVGMPVEVVFEAVDEAFTLPLFRPSAADHRRKATEA
jgi:uncharacterized OB-fold protein/acyl dehydratase